MKNPIIGKTIRSIALISLIGCLAGCHNHEAGPGLVVVDIEENVRNVKPLYIGDFNGELKYIPLRGDAVQLRTIIMNDFYRDRMLVTDRFTCVLSDLQGNILTKIGNRGKGPGEYDLIMSMNFGARGQIYLQDSWHIYEYDHDGKFVRQLKPEVNPDKGKGWRGGMMYSWALFNDSLFIGQVCNDSGQEKFKAVLFDESGKTVRTEPNHIFLNKKQFYTSSSNADADIYKLGGKLYFKEVLNDTLFRVTDQFEFKPVCYFKFGIYGMPKEVMELPFMEISKVRSDYINMHHIYETTEFLFLNCNFNNHTPARRSAPLVCKDLLGNEQTWWLYTGGMLGVYDKSSREMVFAQPEKSDDRLTNWGLKNDFDGGVNLHPRVQVNDSTLAMWVEAYQLKEHVATKAFKNSTPKYPQKKKELEELTNSMNDSDNPVLILCTFKKQGHRDRFKTRNSNNQNDHNHD